MRALILIVALGLSSCASMHSKLSESDLNKINANFKEQERCWNAADLECYVKAYATTVEIKTISSLGVTKGYDNILAQYKKYFPKENMGQLHFDNVEIKKLSTQYAYVTGRYNLIYPSKDPRRGWFSVLMQKIDGQWFIISDHS